MLNPARAFDKHERAAMNADEYDNLERVEGTHWYYSGKRQFVREWIRRIRRPAPADLLLDCGAGTGIFAKEMEAECRVMVLDDHEEALRILRRKFRPEQIIGLADGQIPLPDASVDYVTALDVLEHIGPDALAVKGFHRVLRPGGLAAVTVPASMALWSDWDVSLHHFRRYDRPGLRALFPAADWEIVCVNYTNVVVYPAVWLVRKLRGLKGGAPAPASGARTEDKLPAAPLNALLRALFVGLALLPLPMPFGVSLVLVARRK
jgi:SAM-dependent methyltransferase